MIANPDEQLAHSAIATLLIEERNPASPACVMLASENGSHLFFRTSNTAERTEEEKNVIVAQLLGTSISDFAKKNKLAHFYCPKEATIATPAIV